MADIPAKAEALREPVEESALLARQLAGRLCAKDERTGESCAWYHGLWQLLRLLDLVETPKYHAAFFLNALSRHATRGSAARVLVSGAADYSMLAHVLAAFPAGAAPKITVVDRCETPLELSRWYAERVGCSIETRRCDMLDYEAEPFDAICTHAFFGRFSPQQRRALAARWHKLLRPGGSVITVTPLRDSSEDERVGFSPENGRKLADMVFAEGRLERCVERKQLEQNALRYAERHRVYPVRDIETLRELFSGSGFAIEDLSRAPALPPLANGLRGPTIVGSADYARLVALRI